MLTGVSDHCHFKGNSSQSSSWTISWAWTTCSLPLKLWSSRKVLQPSQALPETTSWRKFLCNDKWAERTNLKPAAWKRYWQPSLVNNLPRRLPHSKLILNRPFLIKGWEVAGSSSGVRVVNRARVQEERLFLFSCFPIKKIGRAPLLRLSPSFD